MKKLFISILSSLIITLSIIPTYAMERNSLEQYVLLLDEINQIYDTQFHIYGETEYYQNSLDHIWNKTYDEYVQELLSTGKESIKETCLDIINTPAIINVKIGDFRGRSTQTTKTVFFQ